MTTGELFDEGTDKPSFHLPTAEITVGIEALSYSAVIGLLAPKHQRELPSYQRVLIDEPRTSISWRNLSSSGAGDRAPVRETRLEALRFRAGELAIGNPNLPIPTRPEVKCAILAVAGLGNTEIGSLLYVSEDTVKTHLKRYFDRYQIPNRTVTARRMISTGFLRIKNYCEELELTASELDVVECLTYGMSNSETAEQLGLSPLTIKSHLARIGRRNKMGGREQIALNALLSGQIST